MIPLNDEMRFEVSTLCNFKCGICPNNKLTREIGIMSFELFELLFTKIIENIYQYKSITFSGMGEALLDKGLEKKIAYVKKLKPDMQIFILTNGLLLSPERFKNLESLGVTSIRISLYGYNNKSYEKAHGVKFYALVKNNILSICRIKKTTEIILTYNVIDGINNLGTPKWIKYWINKADLLEVWKPHNWVDGKSYRKVQKDLNRTCGRPYRGPLQIQVDGTVNMCCFDYDGKLLLGDLKTQSLSQIFYSQEFNKIKNAHDLGNLTGLICEHCDQRNKDKTDVMLYNSKFDLKERVNQVSTTYSAL